MNEQPGNPLDQRVRQALGNLPDAPPPGSPFEAGKLWDQLRTQLPAQPVAAPPKRHLGQVRWLVAASLSGLVVLLTWLWWPQQTATNLATSTPVRPKPETEYSPLRQSRVAQTQLSTTPTRTRNVPEQADQIKLSRVKPADHQLFHDSLNRFAEQPANPLPLPEPVEIAANVPAVALALSASISVAQKKAATYPKRRFRVVHENDLLTDEEIQLTRQPLPKRTDQADAFVRIGQRNSPETPIATDAPGLYIPLSRKPIQ